MTLLTIIGALVLTRLKINKPRRRVDRIEILLTEAKSIVDIMKRELTDIRRLIETTEKEMRDGRIV